MAAVIQLALAVLCALSAVLWYRIAPSIFQDISADIAALTSALLLVGAFICHTIESVHQKAKPPKQQSWSSAAAFWCVFLIGALCVAAFHIRLGRDPEFFQSVLSSVSQASEAPQIPMPPAQEEVAASDFSIALTASGPSAANANARIEMESIDGVKRSSVVSIEEGAPLKFSGKWIIITVSKDKPGDWALKLQKNGKVVSEASSGKDVDWLTVSSIR